MSKAKIEHEIHEAIAWKEFYQDEGDTERADQKQSEIDDLRWSLEIMEEN